ncbi:OmpA family protein [Pelagibius sp. Alg239-R121]|uniref:OmpA family protein n=1 Tax=Pelagibius sp. Alg239-R121 TaxID=2993448 RepID=UPI0024A77F47|nr:OmpA family protein [Pelagibius sp. Alg239-R121]
MNKFTNIVIAGLGSLALVGCAGTGLESAKDQTPSGSEFSKNLYDGYLGLSEGEYAEYDFADSDVFAQKASLASEGSAVTPDEISDRDLPEDKVSVLSSSRERLMAAMAAGAASKSPQNAATAQVMFDCWMQEQEENRQPDDIAACQAAFSDAIAKAEADLDEPKAVAAAPEPAPEPATKSWVLYFGFDSANLSDGEASKIDEIVKYAKSSDAKVSLTGHTDRAGADDYNEMLSSERTKAVAKAIGDQGLGIDEVKQVSLGENDPAVATVDDVKEPLNRRVVVKVSNN